MNDPVPVNDSTLARAAAVIREGGLVGFPTETVYGLGANAMDATAVAGIFAVKQRPRFDPIIVHLADVSQLEQLVTGVPELARDLVDHFWPGPLTLVLPRNGNVPDIVTAGLPSVAIRLPGHPVAQRLITEAGCPIAAPSANRFGSLSPTTAGHVSEQLGDGVDMILDAGPCRVGVESTVVDLAGATPRLLRPGGLSREDLEAVVGPIEQHVAQPADDTAPKSPGLLSRHYAPRTPLSIAENLESLPAGRLGLLTLQAPANPDPFDVVETLSESGDTIEAATGFFAALHRLDSAGLERIIALPFPEAGLGLALNDRLRRAASAV